MATDPRKFDENGQLVAGSADQAPEGVKTVSASEVFGSPADPEYPAGKDNGVDPVTLPVHDAVTSVPLHTPAEQALVNAGLMEPRETPGLQQGSSAAPASAASGEGTSDYPQS